jgi:serine/threonine-protein kinase
MPDEPTPNDATRHEPARGPRVDPPDLSGRRLGDYQVIRRLGRGAMAEVYLAEQQSLGRRVALKVLRPDLARDPTYLERFRREARSAAALVHASIVQIYEVAERDGLHLIAQEYVQGQNLREWLRRNGPPKLPRALSIMRQVTAALAKAADAGIVHRDIKPENIMLAAGGEVKVADFGLARLASGEGVELTQVGMTMGTPLYMSPEQVEGRPLDPRSDLYAFGVTCYHMLAGEPPFQGETALSVALKHVRGEAKPLADHRPDLPPELCEAVHRMLAKDPADRFESPRQLLVELRRIHAAHAQPDWPETLADWEVSGPMAVESYENDPSAQGTVTRASIGPGDSPTVRLTQLMRAQADQGDRQPARRFPWRYGIAVILAILLGGLIAGRVTRTEPLLGAEGLTGATSDVPRQSSVRRQWFYAATRDTLPAWRAVIDYFPDESYDVNRAWQQIALIHLLEGREDRAMHIFAEMAQRPDADARLRAFGLAGRGVVLALRGDHEQSARAFDEFYPLRDNLTDPRLLRLVRESVERNRQALGAGDSRKWREFLDSRFAAEPGDH